MSHKDKKKHIDWYCQRPTNVTWITCHEKNKNKIEIADIALMKSQTRIRSFNKNRIFVHFYSNFRAVCILRFAMELSDLYNRKNATEFILYCVFYLKSIFKPLVIILLAIKANICYIYTVIYI